MMPKNELAEYAAKKAFEISYAIFRIAENIRQSGRENFAVKLEEYALAILDGATGLKINQVVSAIAGADYFVKLGGGIGIIGDANCQVLAKELAGLNAAILELDKPRADKKVPDLDISAIFQKSEEYEEAPAGINKELMAVVEEDGPEKDHGHGHGDHDHGHDGSDNDNDEAGKKYGKNIGNNPAIRQSIILDRIRQNNNCRLKDIQEFLPDSSERTIRYDLQDLIRQGLVIRTGNGGPATYYKST